MTKTFLLLFLVFFTAEILERHVSDCFEINAKEMIKIPKKGKLLHLKIMRIK